MSEKYSLERNRVVELVELNSERKWEYLQRYYQAASRFYDIKDSVVSDAEVEACIHSFRRKPLPLIRKEIYLRDWKFFFDPHEQGMREGLFSVQCDDKDWEQVQTPHSYRYIPEDPVRYGKEAHNVFGSGDGATIWQGSYDTWYRTRLPVDPIRVDQVVYLGFENVNLVSDVWVNENPVMIGHLGLFPFEMDVTQEIKGQGSKESVIAVKVHNIVSNRPWMFYNGFQSAYYNPPYSSGDLQEDWYDLAWSGIAGEATLSVMSSVHMQDAFIYTEDIVEGKASLRCKVSLRNMAWERFKGKVRLEISPWSPFEGPVEKATSRKVEILPLNDGQTELQFAMKNPSLWSVEHPALYLAHIILEDATGKEIDDLFETFGVRTIRIVGSNFYLNNQIMYPRGTHDICTYQGESMICPSDHVIVKDLLLHKKMGAICSRWPSDSRIHYKRIAEYCDQLGYMVSWCGYFEVWAVHPEMEMYAMRDVKAMVRSLRNYPSIIIWEMGDEPLLDGDDYRRQKWYEQVYCLVREEDDSRPILPAGHFNGEWLRLFSDYQKSGLNDEEIRNKILEDYPVYARDLTYWDIHWTPMIFPEKPVYEFVDRVKAMFGGQRLVIFTEFGIDALPKLENVLDIYGKFRWGANPLWNRSRKKDDLAFYGREITVNDWKETQACQAVLLSTIIGYLRESPKEFAGFYFMMMMDAWTYYQGVADAKGNCKLGYFVAKSLCQPVFISGLHGNTFAANGTILQLTVSNLGKAFTEASLEVGVRDARERISVEKRFNGLAIQGDASLTKVGELQLVGLAPGIHQLECTLYHPDGRELGRTMELFFVED